MRSLVIVMAMVAVAHADVRSPKNVLVGPLLGIRLGGPEGSSGVIGVEGGFGVNTVRFNAGFEHRAGLGLAYVEIDPWLGLGGTLGIGVDTDGHAQGIVGLWEGLPLRAPGCGVEGFGKAASLAVGYRYTGVHELFVTVKAGISEQVCLD